MGQNLRKSAKDPTTAQLCCPALQVSPYFNADFFIALDPQCALICRSTLWHQYNSMAWDLFVDTDFTDSADNLCYPCGGKMGYTHSKHILDHGLLVISLAHRWNQEEGQPAAGEAPRNKSLFSFIEVGASEFTGHVHLSREVWGTRQ